MKLAVIKLSTKILNNETSDNFENTLSIIKILSYISDVHYFTKILKNDELINYATSHDISEGDLPDETFDALIIINGYEDLHDYDVINYQIINSFKGPVFYIYTDINLYLKQIWDTVKLKSKNIYKKDEIFVTRNDIIYIHQYKTDVFKKIKKIEKNKDYVRPKAYEFFPFYKIPFITKSYNRNSNEKIHDSPNYYTMISKEKFAYELGALIADYVYK